jgi:signal peptidase I
MKPNGCALGAWLALVSLLGAALGGASFLLITGFGRRVIPQEGMAPTFPRGRRVWVRKHPYQRAGEVERGDVVVIRRDGGQEQVWRVIGLPGETVEIDRDMVRLGEPRLQFRGGEMTVVHQRGLGQRPLFQEGGLTVLEESLEDASDGRARAYRITCPVKRHRDEMTMEARQVPPGSFFLLGDSRGVVADSRVQGPVPFAAIVARVLD